MLPSPHAALHWLQSPTRHDIFSHEPSVHASDIVGFGVVVHCWSLTISVLPKTQDTLRCRRPSPQRSEHHDQSSARQCDVLHGFVLQRCSEAGLDDAGHDLGLATAPDGRATQSTVRTRMPVPHDALHASHSPETTHWNVGHEAMLHRLWVAGV